MGIKAAVGGWKPGGYKCLLRAGHRKGVGGRGEKRRAKARMDPRLCLSFPSEFSSFLSVPSLFGKGQPPSFPSFLIWNRFLSPSFPFVVAYLSLPFPVVRDWGMGFLLCSSGRFPFALKQREFPEESLL